MHFWALKDLGSPDSLALPAKAHMAYLVIKPEISFDSDTTKTSTIWEALTHYQVCLTKGDAVLAPLDQDSVCCSWGNTLQKIHFNGTDLILVTAAIADKQS